MVGWNLVERPTEKQVDFAEAIAAELGLDLPKEYTKSAYGEFIGEWQKDFHESKGGE